MGRLDGKVAIITGAAKGQGESEARIFVEEGAKVLMGDILDDIGERIAAELGDSAHYMRHDVTKEDEWKAVVEEATNRWGRVDILINNAGIVKLGPIAALSLDDYMDVINVNQVGVFLGMKAVIPAMVKSGGGSIINISSIEGMIGTPWIVGYVSSKWAVRGMTKTAALELAPLGIRVNSIHPGAIDTDMIRSVEGVDVDAAFEKLVPLKRIGRPDEVARLAVFLASDESGYSTGSEFVIDGGLIAGVASTDDILGG